MCVPFLIVAFYDQGFGLPPVLFLIKHIFLF